MKGVGLAPACRLHTADPADRPQGWAAHSCCSAPPLAGGRRQRLTTQQGAALLRFLVAGFAAQVCKQENGECDGNRHVLAKAVSGAR